MDRKSRARIRKVLIALGMAGVLTPVLASVQAQAQAPAPAAAAALPTRLTLDQAIELALQHNHSLQAACITILQNQAQEITANLRPNPTIDWDTQFLPLFQPYDF